MVVRAHTNSKGCTYYVTACLKKTPWDVPLPIKCMKQGSDVTFTEHSMQGIFYLTYFAETYHTARRLEQLPVRSTIMQTVSI